MSTETHAFTDFDDPPKTALLAADRGLEIHNNAVAPLSGVKSLTSFATDIRVPQRHCEVPHVQDGAEPCCRMSEEVTRAALRTLT